MISYFTPLRRKIGVVTLGLAIMLAMVGCESKWNAYKKTHESARTAIPIAVEMESLYGTADHFITHYGFLNQKTNTWNTEVFIGGRYELTMQVEVAVDYHHNKVRMVGEPTFYLVEVSRVDIVDEVVSCRFGESFKFKTADWKKVYESGGDFSVIGIELNKDPVPDFDKDVEAARRPRVPITLLDK